VKSLTPPLPSVLPSIATIDFGSTFALLDQAQQAGDITWAFGGNPNDVDRCCAHVLPPGHLRADEKI
jgi:hypothetical protein